MTVPPAGDDSIGPVLDHVASNNPRKVLEEKRLGKLKHLYGLEGQVLRVDRGSTGEGHMGERAAGSLGEAKTVGVGRLLGCGLEGLIGEPLPEAARTGLGASRAPTASRK